MAKFTDSNENVWFVKITVHTVKAIKEKLEYDLMDITSKNAFERMASDPVLLVDVLYVICEDQLKEKNISDVQFAESLGGDSLDQATQAFLEALVDFFPKSKRVPLQKLIQAWNRLQTKLSEGIEKQITNEKMDQFVERQIEGFGNQFTGLLGSPALTPDR